jgi:hypothetical protein
MVDNGPRWALYGVVAGTAGIATGFLQQIPTLAYTSIGLTGAFSLCGATAAAFRWQEERIREENMASLRRPGIQYTNPALFKVVL